MSGYLFRRLASAALAVAGTGLAVSTFSADAQVYGGHVFGSVSLCVASHVVLAEQCGFAFANAAAELDEKAPRFSKRQECENAFKRCMIAGFGRLGRSVEYLPNLRGVEITLRSGPDRVARPVLETDTRGIDLRPRTILRSDTGVSRSIGLQAQKNWSAMQAAKLAVPKQVNLNSQAGQRDLAPEKAAKPLAPAVKFQPDIVAEAERRRMKRLKDLQIIQVPN